MSRDPVNNAQSRTIKYVTEARCKARGKACHELELRETWDEDWQDWFPRLFCTYCGERSSVIDARINKNRRK